MQTVNKISQFCDIIYNYSGSCLFKRTEWTFLQFFNLFPGVTSAAIQITIPVYIALSFQSVTPHICRIYRHREVHTRVKNSSVNCQVSTDFTNRLVTLAFYFRTELACCRSSDLLFLLSFPERRESESSCPNHKRPSRIDWNLRHVHVLLVVTAGCPVETVTRACAAL
jgi:hypothetical protein